MIMGWFRPEHQRDEKKKNNFEAAIRNSKVLIDRYLEILDAQEEEVFAMESHLEEYDGSWLAKQAHLNGVKAQIRKTRELFTFK